MINTATLTDMTGRCIAVVVLEQRTPIIAITETEDGEQFVGAYVSEDAVPNDPYVLRFHRNVSIQMDGVIDTLYLMENTL